MTTQEAINYLLDPLSLPESMDIKDKLRWHEDALNMAIEALKAQELNNSNAELKNSSDCISRAAVFEICGKICWNGADGYYPISAERIAEKVRDLPSVQPNLQPTCNRLATDTISRQAAIDALEKVADLYYYNEAWNYAIGRAEMEIEKLSSVQPEPPWIPCSERMPEKSKDVLLQFQGCMGVGFYENGWAVNTGDGIFSEVGEREEKPIAWMPLPEPYKGGEQDGSD